MVNGHAIAPTTIVNLYARHAGNGNDSMLHVRLYISRYLLYIGEWNSAGPGRPETSMYFFARPSEFSATQLEYNQLHVDEDRLPDAVVCVAPVRSTVLPVHIFQRECGPLGEMRRAVDRILREHKPELEISKRHGMINTALPDGDVPGFRVGAYRWRYQYLDRVHQIPVVVVTDLAIVIPGVLRAYVFNLQAVALEQLEPRVAGNDKIGRRYDGTPSAPEQNVATWFGIDVTRMQ
uniref:Uncharacterized protein n=1 Tax=Anopheles culicifacies TaxID=139723 RepID=A0A182MDE9_9DIPT